jgi:hypothetical protein
MCALTGIFFEAIWSALRVRTARVFPGISRPNARHTRTQSAWPAASPAVSLLGSEAASTFALKDTIDLGLASAQPVLYWIVLLAHILLRATRRLIRLARSVLLLLEAGSYGRMGVSTSAQEASIGSTGPSACAAP